MPESRELGSGSNPDYEPFTTIDDLIRLADELFTGLKKLGEYKHPLDIRRGVRKGVESMAYADDSKMLKAGSKTYFFDVKKTTEGKPYLAITESRLKGEDKNRERKTIIVFPEHAQEFLQMLEEMVSKLG